MPARANPEERRTEIQATFIGNNNAGTAFYSDTALRYVVGFRRVYSGSKTPGFSNPRLRPKPAPFRDYSLSAVKRAEGGVRRFRFKPGSTGGWDDWHDTFAVMSGDPTDYTWYCDHSPTAYNRALGKAMDQVKDMSVNVAQMFAERKQTVGLVYDHVTRLAHAALAVRKGRLDQAAKSLGTVWPPNKRVIREQALKTQKSRAAYWEDKFSDNLRRYGMSDSSKRSANSFANFKDLARDKTARYSQDWLALQYGWLPLLADVKGSAETVAKQALRGTKPFVRAKATATDANMAREHTVETSIGRLHFYQRDWKSIATVILEYEPEDSWLTGMSETGISDPLLLAWELMPWSFVVDWFLPVGNYLERMNYDAGLRFKRGMYVLSSSNRWESRFDGSEFTDSNNLTTTHFIGNPYASECKSVTRRVYSEAPRPDLPSFKNPLSITHAANALALLRTNFKVK